LRTVGGIVVAVLVFSGLRHDGAVVTTLGRFGFQTLRRVALFIAAVGCGDGAAVPDGSVMADAVADAPAATPGDASPTDVAPDGALDQATVPDAETSWIPPATCAGLKMRDYTPEAVIDATGVAFNSWPPGSCEGDVGYMVRVNRILCGSFPPTATVIANALGPLLSRPLQPGERALLLVTNYSCPAYTFKVYDVAQRRDDPGAWDELAALLRADGG